MTLFVLCCSISPMLLGNSHTHLLKDVEQTHFGSTSFLALMALKKQVSDDFNPSHHTPSFYNELFFNAVTKDRKKELELLLIYMKTFQRDFRSKCKMAMLTKVVSLQNLRSAEALRAAKAPYFARCNIFADEVFRRLHFNPLLFNLDFIVRSFRVLLKNGSFMFYVEEDSEQELTKTRNDAFMAVLEEMAAEAEKYDSERGWVARRFNMINYFYGPHFPAIFGQIIDRTTTKIRRLIVELDKMTQVAFDESFFVPPVNCQQEKERVLAKRVDHTHPGVDRLETHYSHLFRYYGASAYHPFYNVLDFHMWQQGQAQ